MINENTSLKAFLKSAIDVMKLKAIWWVRQKLFDEERENQLRVL